MVEINNLTARRIDEGFLKKIAREILEKEGRSGLDSEDFLSVAVVGPKRMQELNGLYRKKMTPTDVLAFAEPEGSNILGEVVICPAVAEKNAKRYGVCFGKEMARILIHGILHLLGYDHEKSRKEAELMQKKELYYLSKIERFKLL